VYRNVGDASAKTDSLERRGRFLAQFRYGRALKGFAATLSSAQLAQVEADPGVALVSPDAPVSADSGSPMQPLAAGEAEPTGILRIHAATRSRVHRTSKAPVAVIDTGVELADPDLNTVSGKNCVGRGTPAEDDNGHGTHVAGTIAASNTGSGVVGVAPNTRIYAVKVLNARG